MATRSDVDLDFIPSPRVAEVDATSTEFVAQDIVDTLRISEESFRGQTEVKLVNASGKENLGGGISVGITVELQDTQVAFEGRTTPAEIGTITTASTVPINSQLDVFDTSGSFISTGIHRGSLVINFTDESIAEVKSIESETHIKTKILVNGITNTFSVNDRYQIFNVIQCDLTGGNVVAIDELGNEISPILPTAFTQVVRTAASSATTQNQSALNYSSFGNVVTVNTVNGVTGTAFPIGTGLAPSNNFADAHAILDALGVPGFFIRGVGQLVPIIIAGEDFSHGGVRGATFTGSNPITTNVVIDTTAGIDNCIFESMTISGVLDNNNIIQRALVTDITSMDGFIEYSGIIGPITLGGNGKTDLISCWSEVPGSGTPVLDMGGSGSSLGIRGYQGGINIINKTGIESVSIDLDSGHVKLDSTVTAGHFVIRGVGKLTDNSTGTTTVDAIGLVPTAAQNAQAVWEYQATTVLDGSMGEIQRRAGFGDHIHVSFNNGVDGTAYPLGTHGNPVKTIADGVIIGAVEGIDELWIDEDITVFATDNIDGFSIKGSHSIKSQITIEDGASTQLSKFISCFLTGTLSGRVVVLDSTVENLINFEGTMHEVVIEAGGVQFASGGNAVSFILDSYSGVAGIGAPEFDFNNTTHDVTFRAYSGGIKLVNKTQPNATSIDFISGQLIIDGTTTTGDIVVRGIYHLEDNSTGSPGISLIQDTNLDTIEIKIDNMQVDVDVIDVTVSNMSLVVDDLIKYQRNKSIIDPIAFTLTIFEDDGVTPLTVFNLQDDGGVASVLSIFRRIPV